MRLSILSTASVAMICSTLVMGAARAETMKFHADLTASAETPATTSKGTGKAEITYDTADKKLSWTVTYADLSGPATAGHFHGPAPAGKSAGVAVPFAGDLKSPIKGSATLTDAQAKDLEAGEYYVNVHTAENKAGEIRGQVMPVK